MEDNEKKFINSAPPLPFNAAAAAAAFVAVTLAATCSSSGNNSTMTPSNVQLCVSDLLRSSQKAETLLETLTTEQLSAIEQTLNKIREKKTAPFDPVTTAPSPPIAADDPTTPPTTATATKPPPSFFQSPPSPPPAKDDWTWAATQVAKALADAITASDPTQVEPNSRSNDNSGGAETTAHIPPPQNRHHHHEPVTEIRDGVEWVSFVYSHHRILRRYCIRTDLDKLDIRQLDEKFKRDNCVYPRANLPRETYRGNRWAYETECNTLGWKLAYLNANEIAGKRGLIQRAVDSYRNRYPSMRSRRVARQEKMLNGTLRKRKHRDTSPDELHLLDQCNLDSGLAIDTQQEQHQHQQDGNQQQRYLPKTISIDDGPQGAKCRIRINIESVPLEAIDMSFRKTNCVFPRAINTTSSTPLATQRQLDEAKCNELGWKLAWLNPRQLANRKSLLQRVLDIYRTKFAPHIRPRKYASRMPAAPFAPPPRSHGCSNSDDNTTATTSISIEPFKLTAEALAVQQQQLATNDGSLPRMVKRRRLSDEDEEEENESIYSGTTASLDFRDCFSPPAEAADSPFFSTDDQDIQDAIHPPPSSSSSSTCLLLSSASPADVTDYALNDLMLPASRGDLMLCQGQSNDDMSVAAVAAAAAAAAASAAGQSFDFCQDDMMSCQLSVESCSTGASSSNPSNQSSPRHGPMTNFDLTSVTTVAASAFMPGGDMTLFGQPDDMLKKYLDQTDDVFYPFDPIAIKMEDDGCSLSDMTKTDCLLDQLF